MYRIFPTLLLIIAAIAANAAPSVETPKTSLTIPRVAEAPSLEDFLDMRPSARLAGQMAEVRDFIQREPQDGEPARDQTVVYAGYDPRHLYVVFVCFDREADKVRSGIARRENIWDDDRVHLMLDTFDDQRRGFSFTTNPHGVQLDGLYSETTGNDTTFDTVWRSEGRITPQGYVVLMAIPFKSLRFPAQAEQRWGVFFQRINARTGEVVYWPRNSRKIEGWLNQAAQADGLREISPGRNMQFNPYSVVRSFRAPDFNAGSFTKRTTFDLGLDSKFVLRDSLVFDTTVNPDFSQVESDDPQLTVNQRYEVYFPEKRPFFLENASYFTTPFPLLFTRRIADPQYGARMTGKVGKFAVGALIADDRSASDGYVPGDAEFGKSALFGIVRVNRDIFKQSTVGMIFTERRFSMETNRVGGVDANLKLGGRWYAGGQAITSSTRFLDGTTQDGPAYAANVTYSGEKFWNWLGYSDISPGFHSESGYIYRTGYRSVDYNYSYRWRPKKMGPLLSWGPSGSANIMWESDGRPVDRGYASTLSFSFRKQSAINVGWHNWVETLRPREFSSLPSDRNYKVRTLGVSGKLGIWRSMMLGGTLSKQRRINYVPVEGPPRQAESNLASLWTDIRPDKRLLIENVYSTLRVTEPLNGGGVFTSHIVRSKWNWQFSRELSLRFIGTYDAVLTNRANTYLRTTKQFNADFLVTYMLHPGTAVYVGYNSNMQNLDPTLARDSEGFLQRPRSTFINDARQVFIKLSYLFRY